MAKPTTIQGKTCAACRQRFAAIGYYRRQPPIFVQGRYVRATVVYRCGCEAPLVSCESLEEFRAANNREIKRRWPPRRVSRKAATV